MEKIKNFLSTTFADILTKPIEEIDENEELDNIGFESMSYIMLIVELENQFGTIIPETDFLTEKFNTIKKIQEIVDNRVSLENRCNHD